MMISKINSIHQLSKTAADLLTFTSGQKVFLFFGDMGTGKTTFIKTICKQLGVDDVVSSPTYSIVNEYESANGKIFHFDFYRLKNEMEALDMGFEEYLYSGEYCLIEWPEKIESFWPDKYIKVDIKVSDVTERTIRAEIISK
ncbi:MAG: tRNA (adenosine(37)-N6)-threonylcarbamoyltransferase complex ATPase subunit type 1 TsaE [Daejeonella sp.]